jgi:hypothetical protein
MHTRSYEISFTGEPTPAIRAEFDDCEVIAATGGTTLRVTLPDQAALAGLLQRIFGLRLELTQVRLVDPVGQGPAQAPGHDLTFDVVNRLFSVGVSLTSAQRLVGDGAAGDRLAAAITELDRLIAKIRAVTFGRTAGVDKGGGADWPGWMSG